MKTSVHLISMPMAYPMAPSCQIGMLHSFVSAKFGQSVSVRSYSAFLDIAYDFAGRNLNSFYLRYREIGEQIMLLAYLAHQFGEASREFDEALKGYNAYYSNNRNLVISRRRIVSIKRSIEKYLDDDVLPKLDCNELNVIGFSTTFMQVFASLLAAQYLVKRAGGRLLLIFGGSSMALPEACHLLGRRGIDGLVVSGPGEMPLSMILDVCLASSPTLDSAELLESVAGANIPNVSRIGGPWKPVQASLQEGLFESFRFPSYDEYFAKWRRLCADAEAYRVLTEPGRRLISLPMTGSQGCFARCDFCQIPNISPRFRTLKGKDVFHRTVELSEKYGIENIMFTDSVCNAWAEEYAESALGTNKRLSAFMEMRVHCREAVWTKLALSGVQGVQLGIEALSDVLLKKMRKGTKAIHNVRAAKYLAELGITSGSNLITHHPRSDVSDVEETRRVLSLAPHFLKLNLSEFVISYASPIYNELSSTQRARCASGFRWLPLELQSLSFPRALAYECPREWMVPDTAGAWDDFHAWYNSVGRRNRSFQVTGIDKNTLAFVDSRSGRMKRFRLHEALAHIYDACHIDRSSLEVARHCGLDETLVKRALSELAASGLMIEIGGRYLSLALRPREELIRNLALGGCAPDGISKPDSGALGSQ